MEAVVFIILQIFSLAHTVLKIGEYINISKIQLVVYYQYCILIG